MLTALTVLALYTVGSFVLAVVLGAVLGRLERATPDAVESA